MTRLEIARLCLCGGIAGSAAFGTVAWIAGAGLELLHTVGGVLGAVTTLGCLATPQQQEGDGTPL